jgi:hypothetical protein
VLAFTLQELAAGMPEDQPARGEKSSTAGKTADRAEFESLVRNVFLRLTNGAALPGFTDEQRALAYVGSMYAPYYFAIRQAQREGKVLTRVYARHAHSPDRRVVSVGFTVRHPRTEIVEGAECLVDVTEPCLHFLVTGLRPRYD